jgi:hypothetical protein
VASPTLQYNSDRGDALRILKAGRSRSSGRCAGDVAGCRVSNLQKIEVVWQATDLQNWEWMETAG